MRIFCACISAAFFAAPALGQPVFKAPFGCAQQWDIWTYDSHNDLDSLDMALWKDRTKKSDPKQQNITHGQFVFASAAGVILKDDLYPDDDWGLVRRTNIDHGNGWISVYLHNTIEPDLMAPGRKIAMGEVIGLGGRSGTGPTSWHIHYSQKQNDEIVRASFDKRPVQTHGGNPDMIGLGGTAQELLRSSNCTGRSFARWRDGGRTFIFRYNPMEGQARITRMAEPDSPLQTTWTTAKGAWGKSFTDFIAYKVNAAPHLLRYNARTGRATFYKIEPQGSGLERLSNTTDWHPGWTMLQRVNHDNLTYVLAYDSRTGFRQMLQMSPNGDSVAVADSTHEIKGWTHVLGFDRNNRQFLLFYKASTGRMIIRRMERVERMRDNGTGTGRFDLAFTDVFDSFRNPGWTHLQLARQGGTLFMVGYRATNGKGAIWRIGKPANGPQRTGSLSLARKWDILTSLPADDNPQIMFYGVDAGDTKLFAIDEGGSGLSTITTMNWSAGWR